MVGKCPPKCPCFDQPSQGRTVVNCSHSGKTKLPSALPHHMHLDVDFSHNRIDLGDRRFIRPIAIRHGCINCNARGMLVISFVRRSSHVTLINLDNKYPGSSFMLLFCKFSVFIYSHGTLRNFFRGQRLL
jgi:hypothetical protein